MLILATAGRRKSVNLVSAAVLGVRIVHWVGGVAWLLAAGLILGVFIFGEWGCPPSTWCIVDFYDPRFVIWSPSPLCCSSCSGRFTSQWVTVSVMGAHGDTQ
jgi:hypothetical protein